MNMDGRGEAELGGAQVGFLLLGAPPWLLPLPPTYIYEGRALLEHTTTSVSRVRRLPPQFTPPVIYVVLR